MSKFGSLVFIGHYQGSDCSGLALTRRDKVSRSEAGPMLSADKIWAKEGKEEEEEEDRRP
jgi:hypothetical protein